MLRVAKSLLLYVLSSVVFVSTAGAVRLSFDLTLPSDRVHATIIEGGATSIRVDDPAYYHLTDPGDPRLPFRVVGVLMPQGEEVGSFRITAAGERVIAAGADIERSGPNVSEDGHVGNGVSLMTAASGVFPSERARLLSTGTLHGYTIASFAVFPVRVDGDDVIAAEQLTLEIETRPSTREAPVLLERLSPHVRARARGELARIVINPRDADRYTFTERAVAKKHGGFQPAPFPSLEGSAVDYVIVTPDTLAAVYQVLADSKTQKGVPTVVRTMEWIQAHYRNGSDIQETIRTFVIDAYTKWGITYVLLGGDTGEVPPRLAFSAFFEGGELLAADMYFGCLDGDWNDDGDDVFGEVPADSPDLYAEVMVGRLPSASAAEAAMMIGKIVDYERPAILNYPQRILLLGEVLFPANWAPPATPTLNGADLTEYIYYNQMQDPELDVVRMYETEELFPGSLDENRVAVIDSLENGFNHVVHVGHGYRFNMSVGDVSLVNGDADALTNGDRLSCLYFLNCAGAAFTYSCLAEHFLRNPNGGAVSVTGANNSAFPNASQFYMNEYYRVLFNSNTAPIVHSGQVFALSRLPRTALAASGDHIDLWTHYIYSLLGDPELPMWTGPVSTLTLNHPASVAVGTNQITVTVTEGGLPVDSATVCLAKGEDDYEVGTTNVLGQVTLSFRAESAGTITVVATGRNHARKTGLMAVTNAPAYTRIDAITVDDDNIGGTSGNGNSVIEGGETVDLGFTLRNTGSASTGTVSVTLRDYDAGATVTDSTASGGVIAAGGTGAVTGGCRVAFSANTEDEHSVPFVLIIKNNGVETWRDEFKKLIHQPKLDLVRLRIDDAANGNSDGVVQAGEQFKLVYRIKNFGTGIFPGGNVTVTDLDNGFTFLDSTNTYGTADPIAEVVNTPGLDMIEPSIASAHRLRIAIVDLEGRAYADTVELRAPVPPTALVIDPGLGPDRLSVSWTKSVTPDAARYNLYRALASTGPFTLTNPDPVAHAFYVDDGLSPNTLYYFRATTIDSAGNESSVSTTYSGSTNPPMLGGWPIAMKVETNSSPAVGDIDGDGDLEIVQGADKVYAWHANGDELMDGDGDAQTWGVISTQGQGYVGHVALARIDLVPGLDIIAGSRETKQVFVFHHDGSVLPGWPRLTENKMRAGMVVGDLNGDGEFEIIVVDESGVIYVWKKDGTELIDGDSNPSTQGVFYRMTGCTLNYSTPAVANVDGDSNEELIVGSQGNQVFVFNHDGSINPGWPYALVGDIAGSPAIGDVDANGDMEIVVSEMGGQFRVLNHDATQQNFQFFTNTLFFGPSPALANVTGDSKLEVFIPSKNGRIYGMTWNLNPLAGWPVFYNTSGLFTESSPLIADVDGNGTPDITLGDESRFIRSFNVAGQPLAGFPLATDDAMRGVPTIADVDLDGSVDLVASGWDKNVYVWDFTGNWNAANAPWPRFHANLHNNGRLGFVVPTPVLGTRFMFTAGAAGVELEWNVPAEAGRLFDVDRAVVEKDRTGSFARVSGGVGASADGSVRLVDRNVEMGMHYVYRLSGETGLVHESQGVYVPVSRAALGQNYPNPFNPVTKIEYWVAEGAKAGVSVVVYDVRGARVKTLVSGPKSAGRYVAEWDGHDDAGQPVSSGVYFYKMVSGSFSDVRKMVMLK